METNYPDGDFVPSDWRLFDHTETGGCDEEFKTEARILLAAANLFASKGYAGTAVKEIVDAAGVTKPTLYYYFKNKEDLYRKLMDQTIESFFRTLEESLTTPGDLRSRLAAFYGRIYRQFHANIDFLRLVNSVIYGPPGAAPAYDLKSRNVRFEKTLKAMLDGGVAAGELSEDNREEVLLLLLGLIRSIQLRLVFQRSAKPFHDVKAIRRVIDLIFDGANLARSGETPQP